VSDVVKDYSRTVLMRAQDGIPKASLEREFRILTKTAEKEFRNERWSGRLQFNRSADLRYRGQGFELNIAYGPNMLNDFHAEHARRYGYNNPGREVEIVTLRLRALQGGTKTRLLDRSHKWNQKAVSRAGPVMARTDLGIGHVHRGPLVVTEYSATTYAPMGWDLHVDGSQNLILRRK
jgi:N-methylhydantoinase A